MSLSNLQTVSEHEIELLEQYRDIATSLVSDNLSRAVGATGILPLSRQPQLLGYALTVKTRVGDNKIIHEALENVMPGQIIVVDGGGDVSQALIGEIIVAKAIARKAGGFVIDGAVRDVAAIRKSNLPCFARGITHRGPYKNGPGQLNVPISIGGMVVNPGDLIIGDDDGVLAIDVETARNILPDVLAQEADEEDKLSKLMEEANRQ